MQSFKNRRFIPIFISFLIVITATVLLISFVLFYNSHKVYKLQDFPSPLSFENGILYSDTQAYLYTKQSSEFSESQLFSRPLSQYTTLDRDYNYYLFNNKFISQDSTNAPFSGANSSTEFIFKEDGDLFLIDTENYTVAPILKGHEIISSSTLGSYFLEKSESGNYFFHKRLNSDFEFSSPIPLLHTGTVDSLTWLNDRYVSFFSLTDTHLVYFIADAETGETAPAYSVSKDSPDFQKHIVSDRYFVKDISNSKITLFSVSKQEDIVFNFSSHSPLTVTAVSDDASYITVYTDGEYILVSDNGRSINVSEFIGGECFEIIFIDNSVAIFNYSDGTEKSAAYNLLF